MKRKIEIKKKFFKSLKCGTGRAYFILKKYQNIDFSKEIYKGAVCNYAYDQQSEGSRAKYIHKLICASKNPEQIEALVLQKLLVEKEDWWSLDQMCDLAVLFYKSGNLKAKEVLEKRFKMNSLDDTEFCGQEQLMEVNGIQGVLTVAKLIGKHLYKDKDDYESSWQIDQFQKRNKQINVYKVLKEKAKKNKYIKKYLESIIINKTKPFKIKKSKRFSYELVKQKIEENRFMSISKKRADELTNKEIDKLANDFLKEKKNIIKEKYLRFFSVRRYPHNIEPLIEIVSNKNPNKTRLVEYAAESLKFFKSKKIRKLAISKIKTTKNPCNFLPLLAANYKKGDSNLLLQVLNRSKKQEFIHSLIYGFITIYKFNKTKECRKPLKKIYESMTCGLHRNDLLEIMHKNGVLDNSTLKEVKFDSLKRNREFYKRIKKK